MSESTQERTIRLRWQFNWKLLLFFVLFFPLTISLGFWQLSRAAEKEQITNALEERRSQLPRELGNVDMTGDVNYLPVVASGRFDSTRYFLLDNRVRNSRPGYEVLAPFQLDRSGQWILVNRGWIAGYQDRTRLPEVVLPEGEQVIRGYLYQTPGAPGYRVGEEIWRGSWPETVIYPDLEPLQQRLGLPLAPYRLRLDADSPAALEVGWEIINVSPEKHRGYAVQWFMMAAALLVLTLFANSNLAAWIKHRRTPRN